MITDRHYLLSIQTNLAPTAKKTTCLHDNDYFVNALITVYSDNLTKYKFTLWVNCVLCLLVGVFLNTSINSIFILFVIAYKTDITLHFIKLNMNHC